MEKIVPVILSGGFGTRLWPLSRQKMPKQFNREILNPSFFERCCGVVGGNGFHAPVIIANEEHQFLIEDVIGENYGAMVLEPVSRNTAPAILAAVLYVQKYYGSDAKILVLPSDHLISNTEAFLNSVNVSLECANENIVTFGVKPLYAETGYGYIEVESSASNVKKVLQFREKPSLETAQGFIEKGNFFWNAGIFLFRAEVYVEVCRRLIAETFGFVESSLKNANIVENKVFLSNEFEGARSDSIDYSIMEKVSNIYLTPMVCDWADVGSFDALYNLLEKDDKGNVLRGNVQVMETQNCFVQNNTSSLLTVYGMKDSVVVQAADSTLVAPIGCSQEIKNLVTQMVDVRKKIDSPKTRRPWGTYEVIQEGRGFKVKKIIVEVGRFLSLQSHERRCENWVVISGRATVIVGSEVKELGVGESVFIPAQVRHQLKNLTQELLEIIEVQTGDYLGEDDIVRY